MDQAAHDTPGAHRARIALENHWVHGPELAVFDRLALCRNHGFVLLLEGVAQPLLQHLMQFGVVPPEIARI
jgi:hypothetical protein